ncbi:hypothetical protein KFE94_16620 [bacterium SCSIO 12643]|nr:hypothetical protein KFE94_16620 [bacterium SCSIO 12643]
MTKFLLSSVILIYLLSSCSPKVLTSIPVDQTERIQLEVEKTKGLNPGMGFQIKSKVTLKNGKQYFTYPEYSGQRVLKWDGVVVQISNGDFNAYRHTVMVDDDLKYTGIPDTVTVKIMVPGSGHLVDEKQIIVNYNSSFTYNVSGYNGAHGSDGSNGFDAQGDSVCGSQGGHGYPGGDGTPGKDVDVFIKDTLVFDEELIMCRFVTDHSVKKTMFFANHHLIVKSNGGNGGHGGRRTRYARYKGGNGGNGGHGASGGDITVFVTESAYRFKNNFHFENEAGRAGRGGRSGEGTQNVRGVLGFIVDGIIIGKKEGADGHAGFSDGKLDIQIIGKSFDANY